MFDAVTVGARCAGSPTAMLLARQGFKVLLVDRATFPSDTISTHILWPHGAEILARWGLLGTLAATSAPPICRHMTFDVGPFALRGAIPDANDGMGGGGVPNTSSLTWFPRDWQEERTLGPEPEPPGGNMHKGFAPLFLRSPPSCRHHQMPAFSQRPTYAPPINL